MAVMSKTANITTPTPDIAVKASTGCDPNADLRTPQTHNANSTTHDAILRPLVRVLQ